MAETATLLQLKTYEDLQALPEDGNRYELIFGEIVMSPSPRTKHQLALAALFLRMRQHADLEGLGEVLFAPLDVRFSNMSVVQPDILFIRRENTWRLGEFFVDGPPDIVVEALSPSNRIRDLVQKAALYTNHGVQEYWILDPEAETLTINELINGQYLPGRIVDGRASSRELSGFDIDVREIFAGTDRTTRSNIEME